MNNDVSLPSLSLEAEADKLVADNYTKNVEHIYRTYTRFILLSRIYSATGKCMNIINVASLFYSMIFPEQNYSLLFSLISFSLHSMFDVSVKSEILERLISMYRDRIIPQMEELVRKQISHTVETIKKKEPTIDSNTIDYNLESQKIYNIVTTNYYKYMGETFTLPVGLEYTNYWSILFCIGLYVCAFIAVPTLHALRWW